MDGIVDGLIGLAARHRVAIVGGNITRSPGPLMIDVTAIGSVRPRRVLTRAGARPGDEVYVTGAIGGAVVGLRSLQEQAGAAELQVGPNEEKYLRPEPRVRAGLLLGRNRAATVVHRPERWAGRRPATDCGRIRRRDDSGRGGNSLGRRRGRVSPNTGR